MIEDGDERTRCRRENNDNYKTNSKKWRIKEEQTRWKINAKRATDI